MPWISEERLAEARKLDLLTYLQEQEPHELMSQWLNSCAKVKRNRPLCPGRKRRASTMIVPRAPVVVVTKYSG